jgi:hypothetical protein
MNITATAGFFRAAVVPVFRFAEAVFDGAAREFPRRWPACPESSTAAISHGCGPCHPPLVC